MAGRANEHGRSVADKVVSIMCAFTHRDELTNVQIARLADLPASTTHRLVGQLVAGGILERTAKRRYRVGPNVRAMATVGFATAVPAGPGAANGC